MRAEDSLRSVDPYPLNKPELTSLGGLRVSMALGRNMDTPGDIISCDYDYCLHLPRHKK